jgi:hypothetical protein
MSQNKKDKLLEVLVNIGFVLAFSLIVYIIYKFFIETNYNNLRTEGFVSGSKDTVYELALKTEFNNNQRMLCSLIPTTDKSTCKIADTPYVIYNFPVHMIKLIDGTILAVFNDGRLYQKQSITSTMWKGPIENSMPKNTVPLRMITLTTDFNTLLGVGYDNILYMKSPDKNGNLDIKGVWKQVPNNNNIIYVIFDRSNNYMVSIDINGKLLTKSSTNISTKNKELKTLLDRPVLRLYYDLNGYMLVIDNKFNMYQFNDINWKESSLNLERGPNPNKLQDIIYHNDGKLFGLIFNPDAYMVQIMKQSTVFYLGEFFPVNLQITPESSEDFVMSDQDIIKSKIGSDFLYNEKHSSDESADDDPNFAYQKQLLENKQKLREFCSSRNLATGNSNNTNNFELLANVEDNNDNIKQLKSVLSSLIKYEPEKDILMEKYPNILKQ